MARQSLREVFKFVDEGPTMYVSKSMTFPTPHIGHSRNGLFFIRLNCQSNAKPSEKDHELPGIRSRDLWSSSQSQHTQPLPHLGVTPILLKFAIFPILLDFFQRN
jgi:hypothetical protein